MDTLLWNLSESASGGHSEHGRSSSRVRVLAHRQRNLCYFAVAIIMLLPLFVAANGDDRIVLQMQVICTAITNVAIPIPSSCTRS